MLPPPSAIPADGEDESLPFESESESWLELLRDGYVRQLREENEYPEPPPFNKVVHFAANPGEPVPPGKYPRKALNIQLTMLLRARAVDGQLPPPTAPGQQQQKAAKPQLGPWVPTKGGGAKGISVLPQLLLQMQQNGSTQSQLILEAAKRLADAKNAAAAGGKGKGKGSLRAWTPVVAPY